MKSLNQVQLIGNVTRDPELRITSNDNPICTFGLATNRVWRDNEGEKKSLPEYHNIVAWGNLAEFCDETVKKGKALYVSGYLKTRSWDNEEGAKIFRTEVVIEDMILLSKREDDVNDDLTEDDPQDELSDS